MTRIISCVAFVVGCASDLQPQPFDAGPLPDGGVARVVSTVENGITTTRVDAQSDAVWIYFDLDTGAEAIVADPLTSPEWDLGFQRFLIKSNGGVSGNAGVEVAVLPGADFDALTRAPSSGYIVDQNDSSDEGDSPDFAFLAGDPWYVYNPRYHTLTARDAVYVVKTAAAYFKVQMTGFYDGAGTGGFPTFRWAPVEAPSAAGLEVDATTPGAWTYVSIATGVVTPADPRTSDAWDLAFSESRIATNGGTSGAELGAARLAPDGATFEISSSPTIGFSVDEMVPPPPPDSTEFSGSPVLNGWYEYDTMTRVFAPRDVVFLVRTARGNYGKLRIRSYDAGRYVIDVALILRNPTIESSTIDASVADAWVYFDFSSGAAIDVADPLTNDVWDIGFSETLVRTNGGTSGPGDGGAADAMLEELAIVPTAEGLTFTADAMIAAPPPGTGEFSGNAVASGWHDYDMMTRVVSPRNTVFVVRTGDGFAKLEITSFADGVYRFDWVYSGPGVAEF